MTTKADKTVNDILELIDKIANAVHLWQFSIESHKTMDPGQAIRVIDGLEELNQDIDLGIRLADELPESVPTKPEAQREFLAAKFKTRSTFDTAVVFGCEKDLVNSVDLAFREVVCRLSELKADFHVRYLNKPTGAKPPTKKEQANAKITAAIKEDRRRLGWSLRQWEDFTGYKRTTISDTDIWGHINQSRAEASIGRVQQYREQTGEASTAGKRWNGKTLREMADRD